MDDYQVHAIALKTLKQRCEYLQQRLNAVEEENCKLKLERTHDLNKKPKDSNSLEERIIILNKEKSQMSHQIQMITKENLTLWSQLSKLLPASSISSLKFSVPTDSDYQAFNQYGNVLSDCSRESLEEISLKLINGIIMGKNELEKQCSQMVDLQQKNLSENNSFFALQQTDNKVAVKNFKDYVQKLKDFKLALQKQKSELSSAITLLKSASVFSKQTDNNNRKKDNSNFDAISYDRGSDINISQLDNEFSAYQDSRGLGNEMIDSNEKICPMCGKTFTGFFQEFHQHVSEHFDEENDEFVDAQANF